MDEDERIDELARLAEEMARAESDYREGAYVIGMNSMPLSVEKSMIEANRLGITTVKLVDPWGR